MQEQPSFLKNFSRENSTEDKKVVFKNNSDEKEKNVESEATVVERSKEKINIVESKKTKVEKQEIAKKSLDELLTEIAEIQNEKYGMILNSDSSINMDIFADRPDYNPDEDRLAIEKLERDWSDADTTNPNRLAYFEELGLDTPEKRLQNWQNKKESSETEKMEKAILCVFHKFLHSEFLIARASTHDDYFNGIDTIIIDAKTKKVVGAFDEVRGEDFYQRNQAKLEKVVKKAANGGAHLKYGLNFKDTPENQGLEIIKGEMHHIPLFMVSLTKKDIAELVANMQGAAEDTPSEKETEIFNQLLDSFEKQIALLENPNNNIGGFVKINIESFKKTLARMRNLGVSASNP